jgi:histidyl-tRNA synthetase
VEVYPDNAKMKKQMTYANKKNIGFVALVGEEEMNAGTVTLKNMKTGEQSSVKVEDIIRTFTV